MGGKADGEDSMGYPAGLIDLPVAQAGAGLTAFRTAEAAARKTLALGIAGLQAVDAALANGLASGFQAAVDIMRDCQGRIIVTGMGKSGHIGQKIAATLASTGTPAQFVHPAEASHGDLGMITRSDIVLALSWSGETAELANLIMYSRRFSVPLIAMTSRIDSALGKAADIVLDLPQVQEACPHGLAPTTSTLMQLALGDCLAIALLEGRGFTATDFKTFHPGGKLGAKLRHVGEIMHTGDTIPLVTLETSMSDAVLVMTEKSFGCLGVIADDGDLLGVITDGDLRRHMSPDLLRKPVSEIMTRGPRTVSSDTLLSEALQIINTSRITALFVLRNGKPAGIIHVHDILRAGAA
jgi:arabinose-5-phosphate isomerase